MSSRATWIGMIALGFWASLALLTVYAEGIPPFQLLALNTGTAFLSGLILLAWRGRAALGALRQPAVPWLTSLAAIFLYHSLYFYALSKIPPARASLIAYFWPLLIVILSGISARAVRMGHLAGAIIGMAGVAILFMDRGAEGNLEGTLSGYLAAACCAVIWATYSVSNRRFAAIPSEMLVGTCGGVAVLSAIFHVLFETTVAPTPSQWGVIVLLGLGPVGLAFLAWDHATKHGNVALLGAMSYLTPLASTLLLVASDKAEITVWLGLSATMIVTGAVVAGRARR